MHGSFFPNTPQWWSCIFFIGISNGALWRCS